MCCHHQAGLQISPPKHWPGAGENIATLIMDQLVKWGPFSLTSCIWAPLSLTSCIWPIWTPFSLTYIKKVPLSTGLQKRSLTNHFHGLISFTKLCVEQFPSITLINSLFFIYYHVMCELWRNCTQHWHPWSCLNMFFLGCFLPVLQSSTSMVDALSLAALALMGSSHKGLIGMFYVCYIYLRSSLI